MDPIKQLLQGNCPFVPPGVPKFSRKDFPANFVFGSATAAYQVEGAYNKDGKGPSIWDIYAHIPGNIKDGSNGDVAADEYNPCHYKQDILTMSLMGFDFYRFSISWPRIFPDGLGTNPNEKGIAYYNNVIDEVLARGMKPFVTLYHWDLPHNLQQSFGGWLSKEVVKYFAIYAGTCFEKFGHKVQHWITFNEPLPTVVKGYGSGQHAPGLKDELHGPYIAAHNLLLAHAAAVSVYKNKYRALQRGVIGIAPNCEWAEPFSDKPEDIKAAQRHLEFQIGWFLNPIYFGDYPRSMRERLGCRLPKFTREEKVMLQNSSDFVGINQYTARYIIHAEQSTEPDFFNREQQMNRSIKNSKGEIIGEPTFAEWLYIVPWGMRKCLKYIMDTYRNPVIYITENGMDDESDNTSPFPNIVDKKRARYHKEYLFAVKQAIEDGVNVKGYFAWSFVDNFEWCQGYTQRFGLIYLDRRTNLLLRYPKYSCFWFYCFLNNVPFLNPTTGKALSPIGFPNPYCVEE